MAVMDKASAWPRAASARFISSLSGEAGIGAFLCHCRWIIAIIGGLLSTRGFAQSDYATPFTITTFAGNPPTGSDGSGSLARFSRPAGVAVDNSGNIYVTDTDDETIRKVTPGGIVSTLAGSVGQAGRTDGVASAALFDNPQGIAVDSEGNVYVADTGNNTIRKISPGGLVTTLAGTPGEIGYADGVGSAAGFQQPTGIAVDKTGTLYVADTINSKIRKISPIGAVTTLAGGGPPYSDGTGTAAGFDNPQGVAVDSRGNVYVADTFGYTIRKITPTGVVSTLAGSSGAFGLGSADGIGNAAQFYFPEGVAVDGAGNLYVTDTNNCTVRKITPAGLVTSGISTGIQSAIASAGLPPTSPPGRTGRNL